MLRKLNILPLFLACFLILGHSVFPHTHQKTDGNEFVFGFDTLHEESSIFRFLSAVFSQDLGCDHLENYNKAQHELPPFVFVVQAFLHTFLEFKLVPEDKSPSFYVHSAPKPFTELILKDTPLRAPPRI
ncbi:hypothetical protein [Catalinimonas niigatensis]|uniref:hypothetical protein n=1 Tax=Catalinimonas niigatensis TaxID=1397264 RepID=UPI002665970A|nr:hypothetical protein [Catalinimonas niigatensis]WPP49552.1 hypothetical protein PZB72_23040 [Catalinimonas niigatensis]